MTPVLPRLIRVFVSSTFRDMKEDRDHLVKFIFPQLRKLCEARGVTWGEVDLRWGIPDEDKSEIVPLCLEEVRRCRPYFIGLLGERYGHVPESISRDIRAGHPWLAEIGPASVTELEIIQGVLLAPDMHGHAFFYFRSPGYLEHPRVGSDRADFEPEGPWDRERLTRLKQRIRAARQEGFTEIADWFETLAKAEKSHAGRFAQMLKSIT